MADDLLDDAIEQGNPGETDFVRGQDYFAPGAPASNRFGVVYQGEWETPFDGTAIAVRKHARALSSLRVPVLLKSFSNSVVSPSGVIEPVSVSGLPEEVRQEIGSLNMTSVAVAAPVIKHMVVASPSRLMHLLMRGVTGPLDSLDMRVRAQQAAYAQTVVYSVWERSSIHPEIALQLKEVAECWVPCQQNAEILRGAGVERVQVVPHPYDDDDPVRKCTARRPHPVHHKRFYSIGSWQPRKGFDLLICAFLKTYRPSDDAQLTIKYSGAWPGYPSPGELVRNVLHDGLVRANGWTSENVRTKLFLVGGRVKRSKIVQLHFDNNIYVSASHGEAWCLPAFDAKLAGNSLVHVPFGGTADFAGANDLEVVWRSGAVPESYNWEPSALWAEPDFRSLCAALRRAAPPSAFLEPAGFEDRFSMRAVGTLMRERVIEICRRENPEAARFYEERR